MSSVENLFSSAEAPGHNHLECGLCGETFNRRDGRENHELHRHGINVSSFVCHQPGCTRRGLGLKSKEALDNHLAGVHRVTPQQNVPSASYRRRSPRIASTNNPTRDASTGTDTRAPLGPAPNVRDPLANPGLALAGDANASAQHATAHRRPIPLNLTVTRTGTESVSNPGSGSLPGSSSGSNLGSGSVTQATLSPAHPLPTTTFTPINTTRIYNGLPSATVTALPLHSASPTSASVAEMFLAPTSAGRDENDQAEAQAGPSQVALGKQTAHYDNSDDLDDENAHVADSVNLIARHTRSVLRDVERRHERVMQEIREKHEGDLRAVCEKHERDLQEIRAKHESNVREIRDVYESVSEFHNEAIQLYHGRLAELVRSRAGAGILEP
ncbi:hypothetical protein PG996_015947 [Apiospora saccharicola]|uniref:C2H2-type domain-containing protein n=1 Tax=Apiospora saccharicola TaxID=335842 RepID=A0ABR1TQC1_9PEZI